MRYSKLGLHMAALVVAFARKHLIHVDGELPPNGVAFQPIEFVDFQIDNIIRPIFANVDPKTGRRRKKKVLIGLPRDGAKSEIAAVIVLAVAFLWPKYKGQYYFIARDREQATAVFDKVSTMVLHDPMLRRACDVQASRIIIKETKAKFQVLPGDPKSVQSKHADVCIVDEYHVHKNDKVLNAMSSGMIGNWDAGALLIVLSTAAEDDKGPLKTLRAKWEKDPEAHVYWAGASETDDGHDPKVWRKATPMPWISDSALKTAHDTLPFHEFERYHLNRTPTTAAETAALTPRQVTLCERKPSQFDWAKPFAVGIDGAQGGDAFGIICVQSAEDDFYDFKEYVFDDPPEDPGFYDFMEIAELIAKIKAEHHPGIIAVDPARLLMLAQYLEQRFGVVLVGVSQSSWDTMVAATTLVVNAVKTGKARIGGCPKLAEHLRNARLAEGKSGGKRFTSEGSGASKKRIDAAIAAAIAMYATETQEPEAPSFAATGGLYSLPL